MGRGPLGSIPRAALPGASGSASLTRSQLSPRCRGQSGLHWVHRPGGVCWRDGALCAQRAHGRSPALCPQNRTTASRGTTSCTRATARAAPTCWWSTPRPAASAARWTCSWPRPSSSRFFTFVFVYIYFIKDFFCCIYSFNNTTCRYNFYLISIISHHLLSCFTCQPLSLFPIMW